MRESSTRIKIFKNFKEKKAFKPEFGADGIFGGHLLAVRSSNSLSFYDWESLELVRRIEIVAKSVSDPVVVHHTARKFGEEFNLAVWQINRPTTKLKSFSA